MRRLVSVCVCVCTCVCMCACACVVQVQCMCYEFVSVMKYLCVFVKNVRVYESVNVFCVC